MNKKMFIVLIIIAIICPIFILFISHFDTVQDLMKPPRLYGDNEEIQTAFEKSLKNSEDLLLKYPLEGEHRSAYVMYDVDVDGQDEAFVFYTLKSDETIVRVNVLDRVKGKWVSVSDTAGYGSEVVSISFVDMNNDDQSEIVVCWSLYESKTSKVVTIHKTSNQGEKITNLKTMANESCSYFKMVDLDSDGYTEMFLSQIDSSKDIPKAYAKLLKISNDNTISVVGEVNLDGSVSGYSSFKVETDPQGNPPKIYIDANKGENQMITEVVYWNKNTSTLEAPLLDSETLTNLITLRTPGISSMDINGDGKIEIPTQADKNNDSSSDINNSTEIRVGITKWCTVIDNYLVPKVYSIVNYNDLYILIVDSSDAESIVVYNNLKQRKLTVNKKSPDGQKGEELFSIITVAVGDWSNNPKEGYSILKRNDSLVYAYNISPAGTQAGIQPETLASNIKILQ